MNPKELDRAFQAKKNIFHAYVNNIKKNMRVDIYSVINVTLIKNPYNTEFPKKFFLETYQKENRFLLFIKSSIKFYLKQIYLFFTYTISFLLYKIFYKKSKVKLDNPIFLDIFFLVDNIIKDKNFNENYLKGVYEVFDKNHQEYIFIPRLYGINKNPFKLIKFFKIINQDKQNFLFEYELLSFKDFIEIFILIMLYPFKTLRLLQNDKLFDNELIKDISKQNFEAFSRYVLGENIAKQQKNDTIYSWSEFQLIERSFNYGIRTNNQNIKINACQFYLNYETYFNSYVDDIDFDMLSSPHRVLVNGSYYIQQREKIKYQEGVALRYKSVYEFGGIKNEKNILLLGSYIEEDTKYMLESVNHFKNILFKNHPAVNIEQFGKLNSNIRVVDDDIYELFKNTGLVIGTASGTVVEAVACGVSVIIMASQDNLTANPLVDYGEGKVWDIAFSKDDVEKLYNSLIKYRKDSSEEIEEIALWYRNNFFVEPTEKNIIKVFELGKKE